MHRKERNTVLSLATIMAFRMLGLFMILPVFSVSAAKLPGATAVTVGMALGIYGLTQAILQMPFGMLSDRIGRKTVITIGLLLFILGSVICAYAHSIHMMILGRAIQGSGAIGSTILAMVADLTRDEHRSRAMAIVGMTIGTAFTLALVLGPIVNAWFHLSGIFWLTAIMGAVGILMVFTILPNPPEISVHEDVEVAPSKFKNILKNSQLIKLDIGIFFQHAILTALFLAIPILLTHRIQLGEYQQVLLYLIVLVVSFAAAVPLIILAEKKRKMKTIFTGAIAVIALIQFTLIFLHRSTFGIGFLLLVFFTAFTLLEASLPSLISKTAPIKNKGTAMGVYSSSQFFGIFVGGLLGGLVLGHFSVIGIFILCTVFALLWFAIAITMQEPPYLSTLIFSYDKEHSNQQALGSQLNALPGVAEVAFMQADSLIYLKVDKQIISKDELRKTIEAVTLG